MEVNGIKVYYNGKYNSVFYPPNWNIDYGIGEILLDVYETDVDSIIRIISKNIRFDNPINIDSYNGVVKEIKNIIEPIHSVVIKSIILSEMDIIYYMNYLKHDFSEKLQIETVNQLIEKALDDFREEMETFKFFFEAVIADLNKMASMKQIEIVTGFKTLFRGRHFAQNFQYEIIIDPYNGEFMSVYTIRNLLSLLAFEYSHMQESGTKIKICRNCGRYFIPEGRSDVIYCHFISPQDKKRTCRQIGAQIAMKNRLKGDDTVKAYRKKYQSLNMAFQRECHKEIKQRHLEKREQFKNTGKIKKKELEAGNITAEEYIKWCEEFL